MREIAAAMVLLACSPCGCGGLPEEAADVRGSWCRTDSGVALVFALGENDGDASLAGQTDPFVAYGYLVGAPPEALLRGTYEIVAYDVPYFDREHWLSLRLRDDEGNVTGRTARQITGFDGDSLELAPEDDPNGDGQAFEEADGPIPAGGAGCADGVAIPEYSAAPADPPPDGGGDDAPDPSGPCEVGGPPCPGSQLCMPAFGQCRGAGVCRDKPDLAACNGPAHEVCGCDGTTYANADCAAASGALPGGNGPCG